jgi:hypothetical protein
MVYLNQNNNCLNQQFNITTMSNYKRRRMLILDPSPRNASAFDLAMSSFPQLHTSTSVEPTSYERGPATPKATCLKSEKFWKEIEGDEEEMMWLAKKLGLHFGELLSQMTLRAGKISVNNVKSFSLSKDYLRFPSIIRVLFDAMVSAEKSQEESVRKKKRKMTLTCLTVLLKARDLHSITCFGLSFSMYVYWISGSKILVDTLSQYGLGVCYTTVLRYEKSFADVLPPDLEKTLTCDIVVWFDNLQKSWTSSHTSVVNRACHMSIVTNIVSFNYPESKLTFQPLFQPSQWRKNTPSLQDFLPSEGSCLLLNTFLETFLEEIFEQEKCQAQSETVTLFVKAQDQDILDRQTKQCPKCLKRYNTQKQKCADCIIALPLVGDRVYESSALNLLSKENSKPNCPLVTMYTVQEGGIERASPVSLKSLGSLPTIESPPGQLCVCCV